MPTCLCWGSLMSMLGLAHLVTLYFTHIDVSSFSRNSKHKHYFWLRFWLRFTKTAHNQFPMHPVFQQCQSNGKLNLPLKN